MTDDSGALSIDFLAGITIFIIAFIWVVSLVPGLLINLQGFTIDYDAVAYRTGVILVEDPGDVISENTTSPWESQSDKDFVARFGLALSRDTPNILSQEKVDRFFCTTEFIYPDDYQKKAIFGDYPYGFRISLRDVERNVTRSVGDVLPEGYGYIRRLVKIKGVSNATINKDSISSYHLNNTEQNVTSHKFSILINTPQLYTNMTDLSYQIDPASNQIMINITDLNSTMTNKSSKINLTDITVAGNTVNTLRYSTIPDSMLSLDDNIVYLANKLPQRVNNSISLTLSPSYFRQQVYPGLYDKAFYKPIYINLSFTLDSNSTFLNNSWSSPFDYNYDANNVTQPKLRDAVVEVAVWSGATTTYGGSAGPQPPVAAFSGTPLSGPPVPLIVQFTDTSTGGVPNSWKWEYNKTSGGGWIQFSTVQNPSNSFSAGTYDIRLTASNGYGSSNETKFGYITVPYTITATAGSNGTITPSGAVYVNSGASQTFTIAPTTNYHITDVLANGSSVGAVTSYTFNNVVKDHTISASFAPNVPTFTSISPAFGSTVGNEVVTITGTNLTGATTVTFGGTNALGFTVNSATQITATTPGHVSGAWPVVVTTAGGTATGTYTYYLPLVAAFTWVQNNPPAAHRITFSDTSTGSPTSWDWNFGDGSLHSTVQNPPMHTYALGGTYTVTLTITRAGDGATTFKINSVAVT